MRDVDLKPILDQLTVEDCIRADVFAMRALATQNNKLTLWSWWSRGYVSNVLLQKWGPFACGQTASSCFYRVVEDVDGLSKSLAPCICSVSGTSSQCVVHLLSFFDMKSLRRSWPGTSAVSRSANIASEYQNTLWHYS